MYELAGHLKGKKLKMHKLDPKTGERNTIEIGGGSVMRRIIVILAGLSFFAAPAKGEDNLNPGDTIKDCDTCPEMVVIPRGRGMIGLHPQQKGAPFEKPWQSVTIDYGLAVGKFELLNEEYLACVEARGCRPLIRSQAPPFKRFPAVFLRWLDAKDYVDWLAQKTGKPYRLLTEKEWEYAARGGTETAFWWGDDFQQNMAICRGCMSQLGVTSGVIREGNIAFRYSLDGIKYPFPWTNLDIVPPNPFGLFHMAGNAAEWVSDCLKPKECQDNQATVQLPGTKMPSRVVRGNEFSDRVDLLRLSWRGGFTANKIPRTAFGTRIALELDEKE